MQEKPCFPALEWDCAFRLFTTIHFSAQIKGFDHPPGFDLVSMKFSCFFEYAFLITEKLKIWKRKDAVLVQEKKTAQDYIFQNPRLFL